MPVFIPQGFLQARFRHIGTGAPEGAECVIGFDWSGTESPDEMAQSLGSEWETNIVPSMNNAVTFVECLIKRGPNDTGATGTAAFNATGASSGAGMSPNVTYLVKKRTALGGRTNRGRLYLPGVLEGEVDQSGGISSTVVDALDAAFLAFDTAVRADSMVPVILHSDPAEAPTEITRWECDRRVATQRNRLR